MSTIQQLNDLFRSTLMGGRIVLTQGVAALDCTTRGNILAAVQAFDRFDPDNDPHLEHDFGSIKIAGHNAFWKIDYYDKALEYGSEDPQDPSVTTRVLTVMLASEY